MIAPTDLLPFPAAETRLDDRATFAPGRIRILMGASKSTEGRPAKDEEVGFVLEISRSEDGADFEWHIPGSETEHHLERGWWLWSPLLSFAGCGWELGFGHCLPETEGSGRQSSGKDQNSSSSSGPVQLRLRRCPEPPPSRVVRYWLGAEEEQEDEEIGRGTMEPGDLYSADHSWLQCSELRRRTGCSAPPAGSLSFLIRLRSGPQTSQQPSDECVICFKGAVDCALYQCGHMCMCYLCARKLLRFTSAPLCPICRKPVQYFLQV